MVKKTVEGAYKRIDEVEKSMIVHLAECSTETRAQNARLKRLETILIAVSGAIIIMLVSILIKMAGVV
jgi:lipopolysaccharide/colanic/teichoic acid biosynthesis glycosyltransferase